MSAHFNKSALSSLAPLFLYAAFHLIAQLLCSHLLKVPNIHTAHYGVKLSNHFPLQ